MPVASRLLVLLGLQQQSEGHAEDVARRSIDWLYDHDCRGRADGRRAVIAPSCVLLQRRSGDQVRLDESGQEPLEGRRKKLRRLVEGDRESRLAEGGPVAILAEPRYPTSIRPWRCRTANDNQLWC